MPLTDIVSIADTSVEEIIAAENPYERGAWFYAKRIGEIELSQLGELLDVGTYDGLMDGFRLIGEPLDDGPWPTAIPQSLIERIVDLTNDEARFVAVQWSKSEVFRGGVEPANLAEYITNLRDFLQAQPGPFVLMNAL